MMDPKVRDLYKRFLLVGRDYPLGLSHVREKAKAAFFQNRDLTDPVAIKKAIKRGRWMVREMVGVIQLKKYRTLNSRYTPEDLREKLRDIENRRVLDEIEQEQQRQQDGGRLTTAMNHYQTLEVTSMQPLMAGGQATTVG